MPDPALGKAVDMPNAWDNVSEVNNICRKPAEGLPPLAAGSCAPLPHQVSGLSAPHDVAESPGLPRLLLVARGLGLQGCLSLNLLTGWDLALSGKSARCCANASHAAGYLPHPQPPLHCNQPAPKTVDLQETGPRISAKQDGIKHGARALCHENCYVAMQT